MTRFPKGAAWARWLTDGGSIVEIINTPHYEPCMWDDFPPLLCVRVRQIHEEAPAFIYTPQTHHLEPLTPLARELLKVKP